MNIIYESRHFREVDVVATYARRYSNGEIKFYDVNAKSRTIREYWQRDGDTDPLIVGRCRDAGFEMVKL